MAWRRQVRRPAPARLQDGSYTADRTLSGPQKKSAAGRRRKRLRSKDRTVTDRLVRQTQLQVTQEQCTAIQTTASLTEFPASDRDRSYSTDVHETEDTYDLESITSVIEELPQVTPQTAEHII
ncbi:hypothetical protein NDU88_003595 [Pleurodeles waltl]|uniref:Uncharacterized protein n=1 Tax=Pleurodeles waltl TaxID=8319 RepID=A0AAV7NH36_PLEWA|nr:hypothetical protein NDU88_003595 [Pleurodeles waltl]